MANDIETIRPAGRLDGLSSPEVERQILSSIDQGGRRMLLDLSDTSYISSAGLRVVLVAAKRMARVGGRLAICSVSGQLDRIFEISGFKAFLDIQPSAAAAVESLRR